MATEDLLSQDEVDALLTNVSDGDIETGTDEPPKDGVQPFDFANQDRIVRGRMPTLEIINERFARLFRITLFNVLRRTAEISVAPIRIKKFNEYIHNLLVPTSLNIVRLKPLRGRSLVVFDPNLVFCLVDSFFGGVGRHAKIEGRDFTATETRVVQMILMDAFKDFEEAWSVVAPLNFDFVSSEVNPQFANIVSPSEVVVWCCFHVEMEGGGGDLHLTLPYSLIEPIRDQLSTGLQSDLKDVDERWVAALQDEIVAATVPLEAVLYETQMSLKNIMSMSVGDVLPIEMPEYVTVRASDVPLFRGTFGSHEGSSAVRVAYPIQPEKHSAETAKLLKRYKQDKVVSVVTNS